MCEAFVYTDRMTVGYHGRPVVKEAEIAIRRGEILTLIGPNGAGKSTLLKSMAGQLTLLNGGVFLDGKSVSAMQEQELARRAAVVFTDRVHPELMTCFQVAASGRYPYTGRFGRLTKADRRIVEETLWTVGAGELMEQDFMQLSDGQKQRILLARALCQEPEILLLDEPTSYLDIRHKLEILKVLRRLAHEKKLAVVLSLHELELAERISDRVACVRSGRIDRLGSPEEIFSSCYIGELYGLPSKECSHVPFVCPELGRTEGKPEVFVMGGGGFGIPVYRRLQRECVPFAAGILWENDLDYPIARALAVEVVAVPAFEPISEETFLRAKRLMSACRRFVPCHTQFGELNARNRELCEAAKQQGLLDDAFLRSAHLLH
ncbi:MAG: ABC transporter ATP-binding protein [Lachnospiraceae bacterium]|nr:ABC transporter ATP-binding protein [Lachnospiraceae bacterium]